MKGKVSFFVLAMVSAVGLSIQPVMGQGFPTQPVEIVVPFQAGGALDIITRLVANTTSKHLGQPMVVVNKPGATGSIGASMVIASKPDGYTLAAMDQTYFAITIKTQKITFEPTHLVPLAVLSEFKRGLAVRGDSPWKTLSDLLDYARKHPGKLRWTHPGRGMAAHLNGLLIFRKAGVETLDIPYKGNPEMVAALLGGHVDAISIPYTPIRDLVKVGKVRCLVTYSNQRFSDISGVPCAAELGFTEAAKVAVFVGLFIHKDTPEGIKRTLLDSLKKTYGDPEFRNKIEDIGQKPTWGGPESLMETIKKAEEAGIPIIKELGLYVE